MAYCAYCGSYVAQVSFVPCASCGNPTNGAPARPPVTVVNTGGILAGVIAAALMIFAVIGILAAIAIPNLLTAMQRSRQKRTMADIRALATKIEAQGTTTPPAVGKDGWGTDMRYVTLEGNGYAIVSAGSDKKFDVKSLEEYQGGAVEHFDCDIVFANGSFVQYPKHAVGVE